ncbi:hypothetical protein [Streptomyces sp. NPDC001165]|uniref:hypothetical protein n=1 Tax=Streptomyces sp. NPDC001165 TaxID=3364546 RepID=UPI0036B74B16
MPWHSSAPSGCRTPGWSRSRTFLASVSLPRAPRRSLLHTEVISDLPWYLRELPVPAEQTLPSLAEAWFGTV